MNAEETATGTQMKALVLIGSPKPGPSASLTLGTALAERLSSQGYSVETTRLAKALKTEEATWALLEQLDAAEIVALAAPLYADSLPAPAIKTFELCAERRRRAAPAEVAGVAARTFRARTQRFVALLNCGFPESEQCATALEICRLFARDAGFVWSGGLAFGMGGAIVGRPLERGPFARTAVPALDLAAAALVQGESIPPEAVAKAARNPMPLKLYLLMGNLGWRMQARGKTGGRSMKHRPYATAETANTA